MQSKNTGKKFIVDDISIKKDLVNVKINSKKLIFTLDSFDDIKLKIDDEISSTYFQELKEKSKFDELYLYALKTLNKDRFTAFQIKKKLWKKGATIDQSQEIADMLSKINLLDDQRYATNYVKDIGPYKGIGKNKILYKLVKEGISSEIIDNLCFDDTDELKKAQSQVEKLNRQLSKNPDKKKKEKIVNKLLSLGFDYDIAKKALSFVTPNDKSIMRKQLKVDFDNCLRKLSKSAFGKDLYRKLCKSLMNKGYEFEEIIDLLKEENIYEDD